jgi:hypothetical protein
MVQAGGGEIDGNQQGINRNLRQEGKLVMIIKNLETCTSIALSAFQISRLFLVP